MVQGRTLLVCLLGLFIAAGCVRKAEKTAEVPAQTSEREVAQYQAGATLAYFEIEKKSCESARTRINGSLSGQAQKIGSEFVRTAQTKLVENFNKDCASASQQISKID